MSISSIENKFTFTIDDANDVGEWNANENPIHLYLFIEAAATSNNNFFLTKWRMARNCND